MASIKYLNDGAGDYPTSGGSNTGDWRSSGSADLDYGFDGQGGIGSGDRSWQERAGGGFGNTGRTSAPPVLSDTPAPSTTADKPTYRPWNMGEFTRRGQELSGQYSGSLDDFINHIFPTLSSEYQGLERFGNKGDKIRLPNGQVIDAVISAGLGGRGYNWAPSDPSSGDGYSSDPLIAGYIDRMNGLVDRLSAPQPINPTLQDAIGRLQGMFDNPGYTDAQRAMMRTNLQEPLESQRASSQQRALARASDRGLGLGSGVLEQEAQGIDMGFDRMIGEALRQMSVNEIGQQNSQRMGAAGQLAGIGSGLQGQELQALAQALGGAGQLGMLPISLMNAQTGAMNALNNQQIPQQDGMSGLIALLSGLANQGENAYQDAQGQEGNFWSGIFNAIPGLLGAFGGGGGGSTMDGV